VALEISLVVASERQGDSRLLFAKPNVCTVNGRTLLHDANRTYKR